MAESLVYVHCFFSIQLSCGYGISILTPFFVDADHKGEPNNRVRQAGQLFSLYECLWVALCVNKNSK